MTPSDWSRAVIERDSCCQDCGSLEALHAHHVKPKATHPELRFVLANGVALCASCHWKRHRAMQIPRIQAVKRRPHYKTIAARLARYEEAAGRYGEVIANLEREVERLKREVARLKGRERVVTFRHGEM